MLWKRFLLGCLTAVLINHEEAHALDGKGFYVGAFGAWAKAETEAHVQSVGPLAVPVPDPANQTIVALATAVHEIVNGEAEGAYGGGLAGFSLGGGPLLGAIEADLALGDVEVSRTASIGSATADFADNFDPTTVIGTVVGNSTGTMSSSRDANMSLRMLGAMRVGYGLRVFGTVGLALGRINHKATMTKTMTNVTDPDPMNYVQLTSSSGKGSVSKWATGWTAGAGVVADLGGHWALRAEYRYVDLGTTDLSVKFSDDSVTVVRFEDTEHSVRLGLIYHFGT